MHAIDTARIYKDLDVYSFPVDVHERAQVIFELSEKLRDPTTTYADALAGLKEITKQATILMGAASSEGRK